jgi:hypothetical protein
MRVHVGEKQCIISLEKGTAKQITVYGKAYWLQDTLFINRPTLAAQDQQGGDQ